MQTESPSLMDFDKHVFPKKSIFDPRLKVMAPNGSPYMISYMSLIQMKSLSLIVFVIFVKIAF